MLPNLMHDQDKLKKIFAVRKAECFFRQLYGRSQKLYRWWQSF